VWGGYLFLLIARFGYLKIKSTKNSPSCSFILGDLKNHIGLGLKNPKRCSHEVGKGLRYVINQVLCLVFFLKRTGTKMFFHQGFWQTP
jgi:hypothetical protein